MDRRKIYEKLEEINTQLYEATYRNEQTLSEIQRIEFERVWNKIDLLKECL